MTTPATTARTNVAAPHSLRMKSQLTYEDSSCSVFGGVQRFLTLFLALVEEADEVLGTGERLPPLGVEVLGDDGPVRQLIDRHAPLVEGACDLDLKVVFRRDIADNLVVIKASSSGNSHVFTRRLE